MPSLGIALCPGGCAGKRVIPAQGTAPVQTPFRWMAACIVWRFGFGQSSSRHIPRVPQHLAPNAWNDRCFPGMLLSPSPFGSRSAIRPRNLPPRSSQLRWGYNKAPRGASLMPLSARSGRPAPMAQRRTVAGPCRSLAAGPLTDPAPIRTVPISDGAITPDQHRSGERAPARLGHRSRHRPARRTAGRGRRPAHPPAGPGAGENHRKGNFVKCLVGGFAMSVLYWGFGW